MIIHYFISYQKLNISLDYLIFNMTYYKVGFKRLGTTFQKRYSCREIDEIL